MSEFTGLLLIAFFLGATYLRRRVAEMTARQQREEDLAHNQNRPQTSYAAPPGTQARTGVPGMPNEREAGWMGSMDADNRTLDPMEPHGNETPWRGSLDSGSHTADSRLPDDRETPWFGSFDRGSQPIASRLSDNLRYTGEGTGTDMRGLAEAPPVPRQGIVPRLSGQVAVQAVVLHEIFSRPRSARLGKRLRN